MENGLKTINELFDGKKIFSIPKYQRAYSWEEKQLNDFFDDIYYQDEDKEYFFGTILFQEKGKIGYFDNIDIVDGQQRITTLIIFLSILLKLLKIKDVEILIETYVKYKNEYKLRVLEDDNEFFRSYIIENNKVTKSLIKTPSQHRLLFAKNYFQKRLSKLDGKKLNPFLKKLDQTKVLTYSVIDSAEATLIFETTNDRGKSLTNLEKTKSFLMYKTYLSTEEPETHLQNIQNRFSEIYRDYENIEHKIDEDTILQHHFIAFEEWTLTKSEKQYQKYVEMLKSKINYMLNEKKKKNETNIYINKYSRELRETFSLFKEFYFNDADILWGFWILNRQRNFLPLILKCLKLDNSEKKDNFQSIVKLIEIFIFRVYGVMRRPVNTGDSTLYGYARDFSGDFVELKKQIKELIINYSSDLEFKNNLQSTNFYGELGSIDRNYFFWKYENYLRQNEQPISAKLNPDLFWQKSLKNRITIEHIIPQSPKEKLKVVKAKRIMPKHSEKFIETYLHSIGNLTIDPMSANSSKSNKDFETKNSKYFTKAPFKIQNELDVFVEDGKFNEKSIKKRSEKIINFALSEWGVKTV